MIEEVVRPEEMGEVDEAKREFMKKFGKYAATAPVGMYLLMSPSASKAQASGSTTHCHGGGTVTWTPHWGRCHIKQYVHYEANGKPNGRCVIDLDTSFYRGDLRVVVKHKKRIHVKVKLPNGRYHTIFRTSVNEVMNDPFWNGTPLYNILNRLNLHT